MSGALFDPGDVVCFGDAHPVVAIGPDGDRQMWLVDLDHDEHTGQCCRFVVPAHERLGRLPSDVRARVWPCEAVVRHGIRRGEKCSRAARPGSARCKQHAWGS